jgi:hypothetical protein
MITLLEIGQKHCCWMGKRAVTGKTKKAGSSTVLPAITTMCRIRHYIQWSSVEWALGMPGVCANVCSAANAELMIG